ncbi:hypothetical protein RB195_016549 [Necator americanus]|uniref:Glycosyltransferase family 92 protein n=1 Tax=Necator americanus TaxID=51031 RepID=A0ABR1C0Z1_NECAM
MSNFLDREIDGAMPKCVPHSELMIDEILRGANVLNSRGANKTKFIPLAAFSYGDYTMVTTTADGYYGTPAICRYFDEYLSELSPQYSSVVFPNFAVHCCTQHDAVYMSVTLSPTENIVKFVNVTERKPGALKYNMSVCLAPLYGNESKWMYLVQLFEHYKLQGVVHFYVYIYQIDEYSEKLLLDYEKTEEVELVYFDGNDRRPAKNWQFVALQVK